MENENHPILKDDELIEVPKVLFRREKFRNIICSSIKNKNRTFANAVFITGKAGSGKTTLVTEFLEELKGMGTIDDFVRASGHITTSGLYNWLRPDPNKFQVKLLDDVDCLYDQGCLELLKSALDTKNRNTDNRKVYYNSRDASSYYFSDYLILITNSKFENPTVHLQAVLDRVHLMEIDLNPQDMFIFNCKLIDDFIVQNPDGLEYSVLERVADFFNSTIRRWFDANAFVATNTNFSIRLIKKFIDLIIMFDNDWTEYSLDYKKLENYTRLNTKPETITISNNN